jgi:decaprenylphospho-beta-D-ribofuranose 2-oxidase
MPESSEERLLAGWGRVGATRSVVKAPRDAGEVQTLLAEVDGDGVVARGLGRSYGDASQCAGGTVVDTVHLDDVRGVNVFGEVEVGAGTSLDALLRRTIADGWFLPVTPGTRHVTMGGAIAADVHGKNHHVDGTFAQHVTAMTIATPTGVRHVSPQDDGALFWATAGGMGLTGIVTSARLRMLEVETDRMLVDTDRFSDLDAVMAAMQEGDDRYRYSVAWVDCSRPGEGIGAHRGRRTGAGRAVLTRANHARSEDLPPAEHARVPAVPPGPRWRVPRHIPRGVLNRATIAAFNEAWYRHAPAHREAEVQSMWRYFHPLDAVGDWNRLYGRRGFLQYQFVVPSQRGDVVDSAVRALSMRRIPSFLAVLKRLGPSSPGPLSFPMPGWTLAVDVPLGAEGLEACLDHLDGLIAEAGGRVYLAKDSRLRPDLLATMYPRLAEYSSVRHRIDPHGVLRSDLSRRLALD